MKLKLCVEVRPLKHGMPSDMAVFVAVNKLDQEGQKVNFYGTVGCRQGGVSRGYGRWTIRTLNPEESTEYEPVLLAQEFDSPPKEGDVVCLEISLYPQSTFFASGEALELVVSARTTIPTKPFFKDDKINGAIVGTHVIHMGGGKYDSHLLVPKIEG